MSKRSACSRICSIRSGAHDSFAESGEVLDLGGGHEGATELGSLEEQGARAQRARCVDTSGVAGRSGTDNDDVMDADGMVIVSLSRDRIRAVRAVSAIPTGR